MTERQRRSRRLVVIDAHSVLGTPELWSVDNVHPNPDGHAALAAAAVARLTTLLR